MGFLSASSSFSRFITSEPPDRGLIEGLEPRVSRFGFRPIKEDSVQEASSGWVPTTDPFRLTVTEADYRFGDLLVLTFRVDRRRVPPRLLRHQARLEEARVMTELGLERLNRSHKKEALDRVHQNLLRRALPSVESHDFVWDLKRGGLLFSSVSERVCEEFSEHFFLTFGLRLKRGYAAQIFRDLASEPARLDSATPSRLA